MEAHGSRGRVLDIFQKSPVAKTKRPIFGFYFFSAFLKVVVK
jgi:hypothetical protein